MSKKMMELVAARQGGKIHIIDIEGSEDLNDAKDRSVSFDGQRFHKSNFLDSVEVYANNIFCQKCVNKVKSLGIDEFSSSCKGLVAKIRKLTGKSVRKAILKKNDEKVYNNEMRPTTKGESFKGKLRELSGYLYQQENEIREKLVRALIEFYENTGFMVDSIGFEWEDDEVESEDVVERYRDDLEINIYKRD